MMTLLLDDGPEAMDFDTHAVSREVRHAPNTRPWRWVSKPTRDEEPKPKGESHPCKP